MSIFGFGKNNGNNATPTDTTPKPLGQAVQTPEGTWEQDYSVWNGTAWVTERYVHNGTDWVKKSKIDLTKAIPNTAAGISLKKSCISLEKTVINLSKSSGMDISGHRARVAVVMDYSGSMSMLYRNGMVQETLTRLMPLALRFDDNGELDVWIFENSYRRLESMTLENFDGYVQDYILSKGYRMGATSYAPVLEDVLRKYFVEDAASANIPTYVVFVTDGNNDDKTATDRIVRESAHKNIFIQFVGIGNERFEYLQKLDDLTGRPVDNTGFFKVEDMRRKNDEELYGMMLEQYPDWLKNKKC